MQLSQKVGRRESEGRFKRGFRRDCQEERRQLRFKIQLFDRVMGRLLFGLGASCFAPDGRIDEHSSHFVRVRARGSCDVPEYGRGL